MILQYCKADLLPVEKSPIYQDLLRAAGPDVAAELVYEVVEPPDPEVDDDTLGHAD